MARRSPRRGTRAPKRAPGPTPEQRAAWSLQNPHKAAEGWFLDSQGYVARMVRESGKRKYEREHRAVMEQIVGRKLRGSENVHHLNGDRSDNTPANLELWVTAQPAGQRPADLLAYAHEIIALYGNAA